MKIQSVSDIITNSSSEVFIQYDESNVDTFKKAVETIFNALNPNEKVSIDDAIEIEPIFDDEYYAVIVWQEENNTSDKPTKEDLCKYVFKNTTKAFKCGEACCPMVTGLKINAKDPKYEDIAKAIQSLIDAFPSKELIC